ncbi:hypothetical protein B9J07_27720 [Sinorhizobium sp. LM21]|uniref:hypothetical protein n=1 Tax=Sinorhizobium sp. LM21 TaxID=1449788 RepID=UPI000B647567|nr:hypothetical protein [Sinorhizobium sp. LM21]OWZ90378.1 hypothetical protein B9J07_27720 [Sinorhizobium sp. LM21]
MSNVYAINMSARLATAIENDCSASNEKKMKKLVQMLSNERLAEMLTSANVDAERFTRAIYACEKVVKFASQAVALNAKDLNENTYAIFRTAINAYRHDVVLTQAMIEASISRDLTVDDSVKHCVYARNLIQTTETIAAQSQTSRDALLTLNIIKQRHDLKNAYTVELTELAIALCDAFKLDYAKVEIETEETEEKSVEENA